MGKQERLTLRLEEGLIRKAKRVAGERNTSVSRMVAGFFDSLEGQEPDDRGHGPITARLRGSLRAEGGDPQSDERDYLRHLEEKHG